MHSAASDRFAVVICDDKRLSPLSLHTAGLGRRRFHMTAEFLAHGAQHLLGERVFLP